MLIQHKKFLQWRPPLLELQNHALRSRITQLERDWDYLFRTMAIACVMTDTSGKILRGNDRAAALLNTSIRHLEKENVPLMYFAQDRDTFFGLLKAVSAAACEDARATLLIRPRERAPIRADVVAVPRTADDVTVWMWFLLPSAPVQGDRQSENEPIATSIGASRD